MNKISNLSVYVLLLGILIGCNSGTAMSTSAPSITCVATGIESIQQCSILSGGVTTAYGFNNMPYALCSQTLCTTDANESVATCLCPIITESGWQSASLSPTDYVSSRPTWNTDNRLQTIQSDYSWANYPPVPQQCTFSTPQQWASCFGVRCNASFDGTLADCKCPIKSSSSFLFELSVESCQTSGNQIWSAAPVDGSGYDNMLLIYEALYPTAPVIPSSN